MTVIYCLREESDASMNKFQKISYQLAKDDSNKEFYVGESIHKRARIAYSVFKSDRDSWTYAKCVDFKNWSKIKKY